MQTATLVNGDQMARPSAAASNRQAPEDGRGLPAVAKQTATLNGHASGDVADVAAVRRRESTSAP